MKPKTNSARSRPPGRDADGVQQSDDAAPSIVFVAALTAIIALVAGSVLYLPWTSRPFDVLDFSEFVPLLRANGGIGSRWSALVDYYATQGRFNPLGHLFIALKWTVLGEHPVLWQGLRALQMSVLAGLGAALLHRLGASRSGSVIGALLLVVSGAATSGWLRLTAAEPVGAIFLFGAVLLALDYQRATRWRERAVAISLLVLAALLVKELLIVLVPLVAITALCRVGMSWHRPSLAARDRWLLGAGTVSVLLAIVPVAIVAQRAAATSYASQYGASRTLGGGLPFLIEAALLPSTPAFGRPGASLVIPANLLFLLVVACGGALLLRDARPESRRDRLRTMFGLAALPVLCALAYMPWPVWVNFYALPYTIAPAALLAFALTGAERSGNSAARWFVTAGALLGLAYASAGAFSTARLSLATQEVKATVALMLPSLADRDSVLVPEARGHRQEWQRLGPTLGRYGRAFGSGRVPLVRGVRCEEAMAAVAGGLGQSAVIAFHDECGLPPRSEASVRRTFRLLDPLTFEPYPDSVRADVVAPGWRGPGRR